MSEVYKAFEDGDIFRWRYKQEKDTREWGDYHCKSQIAVFREGKLRDTYWWHWPHKRNPPGQDGARWTPEQALAQLDLTFVSNFKDLVEAPSGARSKYPAAVLVIMSHPNSTGEPLWMHKGAEPSFAVVLGHINKVIEDTEREVGYLQARLERCKEQREEALNGRIPAFVESPVA